MVSKVGGPCDPTPVNGWPIGYTLIYNIINIYNNNNAITI